MEDGSFPESIKTWGRKLLPADGKRSAHCFDNSRDPSVGGGGGLGFVRLRGESSFSSLPLIGPANLQVLDKYLPFVSPGKWLWFAVSVKDGVFLSHQQFCSPRQLAFFFCSFFLLRGTC